MKKKEFFKILSKYEKGAASSEEIKIIDEFFQLFDEKKSKWDTWDFSKREHVRIEILKKIHKGIKGESQLQKFVIPAYLKYAASILIIVGLGFLFQFLFLSPDNIKVTTGKGETVTITLSEGTTVQLSAESSFTYPHKFKGKNRLVNLSGEAFFKVTKDPKHPFIINSEDISTTVLGTSFNVRAYSNDSTIQVGVQTGRVLVEKTSRHHEINTKLEQVILYPGELAFYRKTTHLIETKKVDIEHLTAWKKGIIVLNRVSLQSASEILERWYNVNFHFEDTTVEKIIINGEFQHDTITNILENIKFLTGIDYKIETNNQIFITKNNKMKQNE